MLLPGHYLNSVFVLFKPETTSHTKNGMKIGRVYLTNQRMILLSANQYESKLVDSFCSVRSRSLLLQLLLHLIFMFFFFFFFMRIEPQLLQGLKWPKKQATKITLS